MEKLSANWIVCIKSKPLPVSRSPSVKVYRRVNGHRVARYVTLASKRDRSPSEDAELERQRTATDERIQLGTTPQDQVMQQALNDYVVQRRVAPQAEKAQIERATVDKLLARMTELDSNVGVADFVAQQDKTP